MRLEVEIQNLDALMSKLDSGLFNAPVRKFFQRAIVPVEGKAKQNAPSDTGLLRSRITHMIDKAPLPLWAKVGTNQHEAPFMEYGTGLLSDGPKKSGRRHWPPAAALELWARRHGFASGAVVARIIGLRGGLRPRRFLRNALKDSIPEIQQAANQLGQDIRREWAK